MNVNSGSVLYDNNNTNTYTGEVFVAELDQGKDRKEAFWTHNKRTIADRIQVRHNLTQEVM